MNLYEIDGGNNHCVHVVARTTDEAAELFVTWNLSRDRAPDTFTVEALPVSELLPEQQEQVRRAFAAGLVGIAHFEDGIGWTFSPPMWQPLGANEELGSQTDGASA